MSEYIEFTAKHTEEALALASQHFGLPLNRLEWEVVDPGSSGLFGLIGAKKAKVRVRPAAGSMAEEMAALAAVVSDQVRPRGREGEEAVEAAAPQAPPATEAKAAPAPTPAPEPARQPAPAPALAPETPRPEAKAEAEELELEEEELPLEAAEEDEPDGGAVDEDEEAEAETGEGRLERDPAVIERAREVLSRLVGPLDPQGRVEARTGAGGILLDIVSSEAGVLIGRRGQHLEALQYLVTRIVSHQMGKPVRISIDAGGYRQRRREALEEMALKVAEKARATGKGVSIGPLSAPERRVVHMTLKNQAGVTTASRGRGELKKVVVTAR